MRVRLFALALVTAAAGFLLSPVSVTAPHASADTPKAVKADTPDAGRKPRRGPLNLKVDGNTVLVVKSMPCTVTAPAGADFYIWTFPDTVKGKSVANVLTVTKAPKGASTVTVTAVTINFTVEKDGTVKKDIRHEEGSVTLTVGFEPGPDPGPDPDDPKPPVPTDKLAVLIIEKNADRDSLPKEQLSILTNTTFRGWVRGKVGKDAEGSPLFRIYDENTDLSNDAKIWQEAIKVKHDSLPWLLVSNGKAGYSGPLPANIEATKAIIEKYVPK